MENLTKIDDLGVPLFSETSIFSNEALSGFGFVSSCCTLGVFDPCSLVLDRSQFDALTLDMDFDGLTLDMYKKNDVYKCLYSRL